MKEYFVEYEVRKHGAIGMWGVKSDTILAENREDALQKFYEKHMKDWEMRFPIQCYTTKFVPTHRHLNIKTNEWEDCEFIRNDGLHDALVRKADGRNWIVGRPFLEKL